MSDHLEKAKAALEAARNHDNRSHAQDDLFLIARIQAEVAQADALTRIANVLERGIQIRPTPRVGGPL